MTDSHDLEKHRLSITERLAVLSKEIERQSQGNKHIVEFAKLLHELFEHIDKQTALNQADLLLFQKLILANARISESWEAFQGRCLMLEKQLGFIK